MNQAYHPVLHEVRDHAGNWVTGWLPFGHLAGLIGTTTADLMRRLTVLDVVELIDGRHRLTPLAKRELYGTTLHHRPRPGSPRLKLDVMLPDGMVLLVQNLEATNAPVTEAEKLAGQGFSQRAIAGRLGITLRAVQKRLAAVPPQLKNWPVVGSWEDDEAGNSYEGDYLSARTLRPPKVAQTLVA